MKKISLEEILVKNSSYSNTDRIKKRLIENKLKENKCEYCGITDWNGKYISLQLHHVDGDRTNNSLENLKILCPNCHSQTDTYAARNIKKIKKPRKVNYCIDCGKEICIYSKRCKKCNDKIKENINKPTKEKLIEIMKINNYNFTRTGKQIGVSTTCIRKWCKKYNIIN